MGKNQACTLVKFICFSLLSAARALKFAEVCGSIPYALITEIPLKDSWVNVESFDRYSCTIVLLLCISLLNL